MQPWYDLAMVSVDIWKENVTNAGYDADSILNQYLAIVDNYLATH